MPDFFFFTVIYCESENPKLHYVLQNWEPQSTLDLVNSSVSSMKFAKLHFFITVNLTSRGKTTTNISQNAKGFFGVKLSSDNAVHYVL